MQCPSCGAEVSPEQKFCHECGASLRGVTEATQEVDVIGSDAPTPDGQSDDEVGDQFDDEITDVDVDDTSAEDNDGSGADPNAETSGIDDAQTGGPDTAAAADEQPGDDSPDSSDDTTVETDDPPETDDERTDAIVAAAAATTVIAAADAGSADAPTATNMPSAADLPTAEINPQPPLPEPEWAIPAAEAATEPVATTTAAVAAAGTATEPMGAMPAGPPIRSGATEELPAVFDGIEDVEEYPEARPPFTLRLVFVLAVFGAIATLMAAVADLSDIRTTRPIAGITNGVSTLDDLGSNLAIAGWVGTGVMVIGGLLACFGLRVGAGLAGGAGIAVLGWAALCIALVERPIAEAESITRESSEVFTLTVTRDTGFWLIAAVGVVGLLVFFASLRLMGTGGQPPLNPWSAAVGALGMMMLAAGPLVPVGEASFADNFSSPTVAIDLPTAYFAGRLAQVALIAGTGVIGFLVVRRYGLGVAAGGIAVAFWLWLSSLLEIGTDPVGIADRNPGAADTMPHGVTTAGMIVTLLALVVTGILAIIGRRPSGPPPSATQATAP
ncbi:MAG: zinc ribbon domain-containing protein [Actinomycetota bacterium]